MLPRHSIPLKEGRLSHLRPAKTRRKSMLLRTTRVIIAVVAAWLVISFLLFRSPASDAKSQTSTLVTDRTWRSSLTDNTIAASSEHDSTLQKTPGENSIGENSPGLQENVEDQKSPQSFSNIDEDSENSTISDLEPDLFEAALDYLLSTAPNELYIKQILRPVVSTGEAKLHDLGLRTRIYKELFETWEKVHLVNSDDNQTYVRNDVVPYIRDKFSESTYPGILHKYDSYRKFVTKLSALLFPWTSPYFADHMSMHISLRHGGRGIVTTAGNGQAQFLLAAIPSFRLLGCDLPVEVMYLGENDLNKDFRMKLEAIPGVTTRDLSALVNDEGWQLNGWAGKPFAILFSSFREALFIDADSLFFVNPESLFDDPEYVRTGALFFRDRNISPESKQGWLQKVLPEPISQAVQQSRMWTGESGHEQESGVIVVDKWMHFVALLLVCRMNGPDRNGNGADIVGTYDMVYGDKETFWLGWELVGDTSYSFHPGLSAVMGVVQPAVVDVVQPEIVDAVQPAVVDVVQTEIVDVPKLSFVDGIAVASPAANPPVDGIAVASPRANPPVDGSESAPTHDPNPTICAPQLLHLDRENRPLWFNGWVFENKFADGKRVMGKFDMFMEEPSKPQVPEAWQLKEHNLCCLSNSTPKNFTTQETEWLEELLDLVNIVGN
ncbi:Alpha-mannosyltransferase [Penicillium coprophilum]|uniref:Alpha-mannosyltransferase n=1 Tax=Penicillium coprophilum TaxID=36646 RepID=UPI0023A3AA0B|nr:Alpha-mannosyltransferase [Penicillium coprophilum]KAJ5164097.1 Alpha-mannosyltransferase [Penicillium coprophilum]